MDFLQTLMLTGGIFTVLVVAYLLLTGSGAGKAQKRRLESLRYRHSESTTTKVESQLKRAIVAMHEAPERNWRVEDLAAVAGMSRSVFSNLFHDTVGEPPASYLQRWRLGLVQKWLKQGLPLRLIAEEAGYGSESSLSRAFKSQCGLSPRDWLKSENAAADITD